MDARLLLIAACCMMPLAGATERLDIKPGLWEITSVSNISGVPPLPKDLVGKIPPEQHAALQAAFKEEAAKGPQTDVERDCISKEDLEQPFEAADTEACAHTMTRTTRTTQEMKIVCSGEYPGKGTLRIKTPTPETMDGTLRLTLGEGKEPMVIKATLSGRWLGPDCADEDDAERLEESLPDEQEQ